MSRATVLALAAALAGPPPATDLARFGEAWATSRGDGVAIAVVALDAELGHHVVGVVAADAPGATAQPVLAAGPDDLAVAVESASAAAEVVVLALGEVSLGDRLLADPALAPAIEAAGADGDVVVAGSGREAEALGRTPGPVAALVVGAVTAAGQPRPAANHTLPRSLSAPASGAVVDDALDGTSVAAGHVGAAAALLLAEGHPAAEVPGILVDSAANPLGDARLGAGYLDAAAAVATPSGAPAVPVAPPPPVTEAPAAPAAGEQAAAAAPPATTTPGARPLPWAALVAAVALLGDGALLHAVRRRHRA